MTNHKLVSTGYEAQSVLNIIWERNDEDLTIGHQNVNSPPFENIVTSMALKIYLERSSSIHFYSTKETSRPKPGVIPTLFANFNSIKTQYNPIPGSTSISVLVSKSNPLIPTACSSPSASNLATNGNLIVLSCTPLIYVKQLLELYENHSVF
ncbi:hypothetical protein ACTXT7_001886 [Hymenolepis weldensis]